MSILKRKVDFIYIVWIKITKAKVDFKRLRKLFLRNLKIKMKSTKILYQKRFRKILEIIEETNTHRESQ